MPTRLSREEFEKICAPLLNGFDDDDLSDAERQVVSSFVSRLPESFGSSSDFETDMRLVVSAGKQVVNVLADRALEPMEGERGDGLISRACMVQESVKVARLQAILLKAVERRILCSPNVSDRYASALREVVAALRAKIIAYWQDISE